jgi:hypothetical protein
MDEQMFLVYLQTNILTHCETLDHLKSFEYQSIADLYYGKWDSSNSLSPYAVETGIRGAMFSWQSRTTKSNQFAPLENVRIWKNQNLKKENELMWVRVRFNLI